MELIKIRYMKLFKIIVKTVFYHKSNKYSFGTVLDTRIGKSFQCFILLFHIVINVEYIYVA